MEQVWVYRAPLDDKPLKERLDELATLEAD
jgi:hypothetical protein